MESFFRLFDYFHLMHDAIDCGLVYEDIIITKNIQTSKGVIEKGTRFHQVNFLFDKATFSFINWEGAASPDGIYHPNPTSVLDIPQAELALLVYPRVSIRSDGPVFDGSKADSAL